MSLNTASAPAPPRRRSAAPGKLGRERREASNAPRSRKGNSQPCDPEASRFDNKVVSFLQKRDFLLCSSNDEAVRAIVQQPGFCPGDADKVKEVLNRFEKNGRIEARRARFGADAGTFIGFAWVGGPR